MSLKTRSLPLLAALAVLVLPTVASAAGTGYAPGERLCRFSDERVNESSGLASSATDPTLLWTHNDSGDTSRFFGFDSATCAPRATYLLDLPDATVPGAGTATAIDWEDMARGRAADGTSVLLLADIGDNPQARANGVTVYEVAEPSGVPAPGTSATDLQPAPVRAVYQLLYPDGTHDAETLVALPSGRLLVATKNRGADLAYTGVSSLYVTSGRPTAGPNLLTRLATLDVTVLPLVEQGNANASAVTGGDVSPDGRLLALRTYTVAFEWALGADEDVATAVAATPQGVALLPTRQGEALAYSSDGTALLTTSEGSGLDANPASGVLDRYASLAAPAPVVPEGLPVLLLLGALGTATLMLRRA